MKITLCGSMSFAEEMKELTPEDKASMAPLLVAELGEEVTT